MKNQQKQGANSKKVIDKKQFVYYNRVTNIKRKVLTMRKFLAALLAVVMLAATLAVIPVAAETALQPYEQSTTDGSTINDVPTLVVTEMMADTTNTAGNNSSANAFQYIEVYNSGEDAVNLYNLALARSSTKFSTDSWRKNQMFDAMTPINPGNVYTGMSASDQTQECVNPNTAVLQPGHFAIIWFWNDAAIQASKELNDGVAAPVSLGAKVNGVTHKGFRDHYNRLQGAGSVSDDLLIVAVYAGSDTDATLHPFSLNAEQASSFMYAFVKDETGNSFDYKSEKAYKSTYNKLDKTTTYERNDKVVCLWEHSVGTVVADSAAEGLASTYIPANVTPYFYNAQQIAFGNEEQGENHNSYEAGLVESFKEFALVSKTEKKIEKVEGVDTQVLNYAPTVGYMDAWQWACVDPNPTRVPAEYQTLATADKTWQEVAIELYNKVNVEILEDVEREEDKEKENLNQGSVSVDKDKLGNNDENILDEGNGNGDKGLGIWLWVIIGGAAAVVLAGVAVVLIIVLKKKKAVAADDVAAEGEVEIIDEQASEE